MIVAMPLDDSAPQGRWVVAAAPWPLWRRRAFLADDGRVFLPARWWGRTAPLVWCAIYDGAGVVWRDGRAYVDAAWLAEAWCPEREPDLLHVVDRVRLAGAAAA